MGPAQTGIPLGGGLQDFVAGMRERLAGNRHRSVSELTESWTGADRASGEEL